MILIENVHLSTPYYNSVYKNSSASSSHFLMELWKITFRVFISWLLEFRSSSSSVLSHFLPQLVCFKIETWPSEKVQSSTQSSANHLVTFRDAHSFRTSSFRNTPFISRDPVATIALEIFAKLQITPKSVQSHHKATSFKSGQKNNPLLLFCDLQQKHRTKNGK